MTKQKRFTVLIALVSVIALLFSCAFCMGNSARVYVEEAKQEEVTDEENELKTLVNGFLARLKAKYGEEYETYYNAILADWGSVEEYLLSLVNDDTPDAAASGWTRFVKWLGEYSPIWASVLAVAAVIIIIVCGKKALGKVANWVTGTGGKFKTVFNSINKLYAAQNAQSEALIKLLGENEKFKEERAALQSSVEEIKKDDDV